MTPPAITGLILAGGQGQRMGGADKGLQRFHDRPLVEHVEARLAPQVSTLLISANRNLARYAALGHPVLQDDLPDYPGPLAGLLTGLAACTTPWLLSAPCDTPGLPLDLASRLLAGIGEHKLAYPTVDGRAHPVFCLCHRSLALKLRAFLASGQRKVMRWCDDAGGIAIPFDDQPGAFLNMNSLDDLASN